MSIEVNPHYSDPFEGVRSETIELPTCPTYPNCKKLAKMERDRVSLDKQRKYEAKICLTSPDFCE